MVMENPIILILCSLSLTTDLVILSLTLCDFQKNITMFMQIPLFEAPHGFWVSEFIKISVCLYSRMHLAVGTTCER